MISKKWSCSLMILLLIKPIIIWSDYDLLIQNKWIKHQDPHNASFRSKNRNDNSLLGASSYGLNPSCAQIYK